MALGAKLMIADTGCCNLASVRFAFARLGVEALVSADPQVLQKAERLVLPGVGAAAAGMVALKAAGMEAMLTSFERPLLGICLGMQLLFKMSMETKTQCLGLIDGNVEALSAAAGPVPHMGWNTLEFTEGRPGHDPLLRGIEDGAYVYFLHSFAAKVSAATIAKTDYGMPFSAIVRQDNITGCQFHPERSGAVGAQVLQNFVEVAP